MILRRHSLAASALLFGIGSVSFGQTGQYTAPGALGIVPENASEQLKAAADGARWRLGPLRIDPSVSLRDVTLSKSQGKESNITAGIGAGLLGYIPIGSKLIIAANVLPEYRWSEKSSDNSRIQGRYGLGLFYKANRLAVDLAVSSSDQYTFASSEVNRRAQDQNVNYLARVEVPIARRLGLFAVATRYDRTVEDPDPGAENLSDLSQQSDTLEGGVRWQVVPSLQLSLGYGTTETDFDESAPNRSSTGEYLTTSIAWNRPKTGATVSYRKNDLRPTPGSSFQGFDGATWSFQVRWTPSPRFSPVLYGQRGLSYSISSGQSSFLDERLGVRLSFPVGRKLSPSLFYETGRQDYASGDRVDDVTSWGGSVGLPLGKWFRVGVSYRSTRNVDAQGAPDNIAELGGGLSLSLGSAVSAW